MTDRSIKIDAFLQNAGWSGAQRALLAGDASNRRYDRLRQANGDGAILMDAPPDRGEDVRPFIRIAQHLTKSGFSAPQIYHADPDTGLLLIEDLGDGLFARLMTQAPDRTIELYTAAADFLTALHSAPTLALPICDANWLAEATTPAFDWYAPDADATQIETFRSKFHPLAARLDEIEKVIILRDFHAENLLWLDDRSGTAQVGVLDFQDALLGHPAYDLVSILQDARRDVPPAIESAMIDHYLAQTGRAPRQFRSAYALLGAQRNLRILGIFARLCLRDGKAHYVDLIPRVWGYLLRNLQHPDLHDIATLITDILPAPTPDFLEHLKRQCLNPPRP
tara:strand:- start:23314 stop:24324 length:1011 start_codon:yes stop_codon:yes gene_type:complete